jgi:hypothetical protein
MKRFITHKQVDHAMTGIPGRTMATIEAKGKEVADALAALRGNRPQHDVKTEA